MAPSVLLKHFAFTTLIILFTAPPSNRTNANYTICSVPYSCGMHKNIGYPFWGGNRPQFCGCQMFLLPCHGGSLRFHEDINVGPPYFRRRVTIINTSTHTISFGLDLFSKDYPGCHLSDENHNSDGPTPFKLSSGVKNISLFNGCPNSYSKYRYKSLTCSSGTDDSVFYYFGQSQIDKGKSCRNKFSYPVLITEWDNLNDRDITLSSVLEKGFEMEYIANFTACSTCMRSGGTCGSSDDPNETFVCYCKNGPQPLMCSKSEKEKLGIFLGIGTGEAIAVALALVGFCCYKKFQRSNYVQRNDSDDNSTTELEKGSLNFGAPIFSYKDLKEATDDFAISKELGKGGFGRVYYGKLKDGREVAVKRLYERSFKRVQQFIEVKILTSLRHCNLVSLYGCTSSVSKELLLVYEYVSNGTVADHLYGDKTKQKPLPLPLHLKIAIETAGALAYLHASDIIHRDVKTNNILLDRNFSVKVADFGLSRLFPNDVTHVSTAPQGTPGYLDPEYHQCYQLTDKSDVYSFGVVLIELITSLPAVDMNRHRHEISLSNYAMSRIKRCAYDELIDPQLGFTCDSKTRRMTIAVAELAFQCLQHVKDFRPTMDEILEVLKRIESVDYEALPTEEMTKNDVNSLNPLQSPLENDNVKPLSHSLHSRSPVSVMAPWSNRSTTKSTSC